MSNYPDCTMDCIAIGKTEFPSVGTFMYFGHQVTVTDKWKPETKNGVIYSHRYSGYFITPGGERVEFKAKRGTNLFAMIDKKIKITDLKGHFLEGSLNAENYMEFIGK